MPPGYTPLAGGGTLLIAGGQHPMCNSAVGVLDNEIEFCMERLVACGEPSMITFTNPTASDKESVLLDAGFVASPPSPALTVEIEKLPRITCPPGYRFQRVSPDQDPEKWISAISEVFKIPESTTKLLGPGLVPFSMEPEDVIQYFQVLHGDEVVAGSMMILDEGVAGIYCVGTLPEHRGQGLGALVTAEPMRQSSRVGYRIGVIQSSPMGLSVYKRIGFQEVSAIRSYFRRP